MATTAMKCERVDTGGGYHQTPCDRDATHEVTYHIRNNHPVKKYVCRHHAPWKLAKTQTNYCTIEKLAVASS